MPDMRGKLTIWEIAGSRWTSSVMIIDRIIVLISPSELNLKGLTVGRGRCNYELDT